MGLAPRSPRDEKDPPPPRLREGSPVIFKKIKRRRVKGGEKCGESQNRFQMASFNRCC